MRARKAHRTALTNTRDEDPSSAIERVQVPRDRVALQVVVGCDELVPEEGAGCREPHIKQGEASRHHTEIQPAQGGSNLFLSRWV